MMITTAAMASLLAGATMKNVNAGVLATTLPVEEKKMSCGGKDGCPGKKDEKKDEKKKEKGSCGGKDGCPGKKEEKKP